jgi:hypothetical protein
MFADGSSGALQSQMVGDIIAIVQAYEVTTGHSDAPIPSSACVTAIGAVPKDPDARVLIQLGDDFHRRIRRSIAYKNDLEVGVILSQ